jgi:hypothetical protein
MRRATSLWLCLCSVLGFGLGLVACFDDPVANDAGDCNLGEQGCMCSAEGDCFGDLTCIDNLCVNASAETSGDGDGDGEEVVVDLFAEACGITTRWSSNSSGAFLAIPCDEIGTPTDGWMVRYPELTIGDETFEQVIGITAPDALMTEVRGLYNFDNFGPMLYDLEFRADVLLRCAPDDLDGCGGKFALAITEDQPNGLYAEADARQLMNGMVPVSITLDMMLLNTFSIPAIVLVANNTDDSADATPEVLIVNPRLVVLE